MPPSQQSAEEAVLALPVPILPPQVYLLVFANDSQMRGSFEDLPSTSAGAVRGSSDEVASAGTSQPQSQQQRGLDSFAEERRGDFEQQPQPSLFPTVVEVEETPASSASPAFPRSAQPSTSSGFLQQRPHPCVAGRLHAPARLPRLDDPNHGEVFDPGRVINSPALFGGIYPMFKNMHELFLKTSLSAVELTQLVRMAEKLAAHAIKNEGSCYETMSLSRMTEAMARRFFVLFFVVSTCQLLGKEPSGQWWEKIITGVPHVVPPRKLYRPNIGTEQKKFRENLADMFSSALQTLKTGKLPSSEELAKLKRSMFCREMAPEQFQNNRWDFWKGGDGEAK